MIMNNKLYKTLDLISRENAIRAKSKKNKEEELRKATVKTFWAGGISGIDLGLIAYKNNFKPF